MAASCSSVTFSLIAGDTNKVTLIGDRLAINSGVGSVTVRAVVAPTAERNGATNEALITFQKATQTINFSNIPGVFLTNSPNFILSASNSSPLSISFSSSQTNVAEITNSNQLVFRGSGSSVISANQPGNDNYAFSTTNQTILVRNLGEASFADMYPDGNPNADANGDGVNALVEFALGGNPHLNNSGIMPTLNPPTNNTLTMVALVRTSPAGSVTVTPEVSTSLGTNTGNWSSSGFWQTNSTNQVDVPTGFVRREFIYTNSNNSTRAFLRLSISNNAPPPPSSP